jgi:non-lysosomal glucosylceramidase
VASPPCRFYLGNMGGGANLGPPVPSQVPSDCAAACTSTPSCVSFTFTLPGNEACYLHPTIGVGVDSSSPYVSGVCPGPDGGDDALADPFTLVDQPGIAGPPLGGIGVGWVDLAPDGSIARVAVNGWHQDGVITDASGTFLAVWAEGGSSGLPASQVLQRRPSAVSSLPVSPHSLFTGAFPRATATLSPASPSAAGGAYTVSAWSPFVPHDVANSSLPLAYFDVHLDNTGGAADRNFSAAFSWQDVVGRRLFDASTAQLDAYYDASRAGCGWQTDALRNAMSNAGIDVPTTFPRVATNATGLVVVVNNPAANASTLAGIQHVATAGPLRPNKFTLQHYNHRIAVLAEALPGDAVTVLPAYPVADEAAANAAWQPFLADGRWADTPEGVAPTPSYAGGSGAAESASAVALRTLVPAGTVRVVRFLLAWWAEDDLIVTPGQDNRTYCGTSDYGKPYHNAFTSLEGVAGYAGSPAVREDLYARTLAWQQPLLTSSLPAWLSFKIINSAYTLLTNSILTRGGRFSMMEGGMGGLAGTMDQRAVAHVVYQKLFPSLDKESLAHFAATQDPQQGYILHFDADFYAGIAGADGASPLERQEYSDNSISYLWQAAKAYQATGDADFVTVHAPRLPGVLAFLKSLRASTTFPTLISGSNTYDDFYELALDAYLCSVYPLALEACRVLASASGNATLAAQCAADRDTATAEFASALWNEAGGFFAYGAQLDGSGRADTLLFGGQVAGAFLGRVSGWGDVGSAFNLTQSALAAQLRLQVGASYSFFPPKVYNLTTNSRAIDPSNGNPSSTWPFYHESYLALAALQAGFVDDALDVLRFIQLVDLRLGLAWSRNLWNPGFITYVAAPVSWFALDVLAGTALDVPGQTLFLSPCVSNLTTTQADGGVTFPVFFPSAWAVVTATPAQASGGGGTLLFTVTKVFADAGPVVNITTVRASPVGLPAGSSAQERVVTLSTPFVFAEGAVLDLSSDYDTLVAPALVSRVLPAEPVG